MGTKGNVRARDSARRLAYVSSKYIDEGVLTTRIRVMKVK